MHRINNVVTSVEVGAEVGMSSAVLAQWHLLSLDAPMVAAVWTWFVARVSGVALPWESIAAMFVAVWVLYASDRLLDARGGVGLEERHFFHRRHARWFRAGIAGGCVVLALLLPRLATATLRMDLGLGALLVGWFLLIHSLDVEARPLPKEFVVGLFFAAAVFVPTLAHRPEFRRELLLPAFFFGALCCLNCLFIFAWEHEGLGQAQGHQFTVVAARSAAWLGIGLVALCVLFRGGSIEWAVGISAALLVAIHTARGKFARTTLRALADLILLTPLVVGWWR